MIRPSQQALWDSCQTASIHLMCRFGTTPPRVSSPLDAKGQDSMHQVAVHGPVLALHGVWHVRTCRRPNPAFEERQTVCQRASSR